MNKNIDKNCDEIKLKPLKSLVLNERSEISDNLAFNCKSVSNQMKNNIDDIKHIDFEDGDQGDVEESENEDFTRKDINKNFNSIKRPVKRQKSISRQYDSFRKNSRIPSPPNEPCPQTPLSSSMNSSDNNQYVSHNGNNYQDFSMLNGNNQAQLFQQASLLQNNQFAQQLLNQANTLGQNNNSFQIPFSQGFATVGRNNYAPMTTRPMNPMAFNQQASNNQLLSGLGLLNSETLFAAQQLQVANLIQQQQLAAAASAVANMNPGCVYENSYSTFQRKNKLLNQANNENGDAKNPYFSSQLNPLNQFDGLVNSTTKSNPYQPTEQTSSNEKTLSKNISSLTDFKNETENSSLNDQSDLKHSSTSQPLPAIPLNKNDANNIGQQNVYFDSTYAITAANNAAMAAALNAQYVSHSNYPNAGLINNQMNNDVYSKNLKSRVRRSSSQRGLLNSFAMIQCEWYYWVLLVGLLSFLVALGFAIFYSENVKWLERKLGQKWAQDPNIIGIFDPEKPPKDVSLNDRIHITLDELGSWTGRLQISQASNILMNLTLPLFDSQIGVVWRKNALPTMITYDYLDTINALSLGVTKPAIGDLEIDRNLRNQRLNLKDTNSRETGRIHHLDSGKWYISLINDRPRKENVEIFIQKINIRMGCPNNCNGQGICENNECICMNGFTGVDCATKKQPSICSDQGEYIKGKCVCHREWKGDDCSVFWSDCIDPKCSNKGTCIVGECNCEKGYGGEMCERKICPAENCNNNGVCLPTGLCRCFSGWSGDSCDKADFPSSAANNRYRRALDSV